MTMRHPEWWRGAVIYQVYLRSFYDSNADGIGDFPGLLAHLDYIAGLGVDAIWITPFYPSPQADFGYDVSDYRGVDPSYGSLADFDAVVAQAHERGLRVIIDQIWSHTAVDHPWFRESRSHRKNEKADWFVWADASADGGPPNNWLSVFGGSAWKWDPSRRQYYLHHFLTSQPKLNLRNDKVMDAHFANAEFWLRRGVDGFRLDAIDFMLHDEALRDNPPPLTKIETPWNPFRLQRHLHDMCQPASQELMSRIRQFMDDHPGTVTIGEVSSEVGALDRIAKMTGGTRLHMAYTLGVMKSAFVPAMFRQAIVEAIGLNHAGWLCWSFSNHDVIRVASRWNPDGVALQAFVSLTMALLLCIQGSVCLYQGEELGLTETKLPVEAIRDPFGLTFYPAFIGRDGSRTPMPWVGGALHSGFSQASETWLPVAPAHDALAVDRQEADPTSTLACYRTMLAWRKSHPALIDGEINMITSPDPIVGWRRTSGEDRVISIFNISPEPVTIRTRDLPPFMPAVELGFVTPITDGEIRLPPFGVCIGTENGHR
jgi:alpha-glucosidase